MNQGELAFSDAISVLDIFANSLAQINALSEDIGLLARQVNMPGVDAELSIELSRAVSELGKTVTTI